MPATSNGKMDRRGLTARSSACVCRFVPRLVWQLCLFLPPPEGSSGFAQKRGLTPYRKGKPAFQPQRVRGLSPFLGQSTKLPTRRKLGLGQPKFYGKIEIGLV